MEESEDFDLEQFLRAMTPPSIPDAAFDQENIDLSKITTWNKSFTTSVLAGLMTEPQYQANGIRLDWLQRLLFSKAVGQRKPSSAEISRALNAGLEHAKVLRLEDPSEDLFCDLIATRRGNFRIFTGQWEKAGPYTQTLLDAFEALPDSPLKQDALASVYAALRISDALAERSGVDPFNVVDGTPQGALVVPKAERLRHLANRVRFRDAELVT
jgi:hypothetical protein